MTLTLETLRDRYVFESTPLYGNLGALHVPFDELTGNRRTETRLTALCGATNEVPSSVPADLGSPV